MGILDDLMAGVSSRGSLSLAERADLPLNDLGNRNRLVSRSGDDLIYVAGLGWAVWNGNRYLFRDGDLVAKQAASGLMDSLLEEAEWIRAEWKPGADAIASRIRRMEGKRGSEKINRDAARDLLRREKAAAAEKFAVESGNLRRITNALELAAAECRHQLDDLDADPFALVVKNGQVDLGRVRAGAPVEEWLQPVDREALPTRRAGVQFDALAEAPRWRAFLELILPDPEVRACVQRLFGAMLFGRNESQIAVIFRGPGGNGKSTLLAVLKQVLGARDGYAETCRAELLIRTRDRGAGAATPEEVSLPGARVYIATETNERDELDAAKIKGLTGGDRRQSRANYAKEFFEWTPRGIPILSCNRVPQIRDADDGLRRRLIFVPFEVNLAGLPVSLRRAQAEVVAELVAEGSGILNWLLEGFSEFMHRGIDPPATMLEMKAEALAESDPLPLFLGDLTVAAADRRIPVPDLNKVFQTWCEEDGHRAIPRHRVGARMRELGFVQVKVMGVYCWQGLAWTADAEPLVFKGTGRDIATASKAPETPYRRVDDDDDLPPF
jgi:putative DNA primase/helicase